MESTVLFCLVLYSLLCITKSQSLEPLCEPDAMIPDELVQCGSCKDRCGTKINPYDLDSEEPGYLCACDQFCGFYGDCCQDFQEMCHQEFQDFRHASDKYPFIQTYEDFACKFFSTGIYDAESTMVVHTCASDGSECEFTPELNEDVNTFVPMYDKHRGVHYISGQCALCNGAKDVIPWGVTLSCELRSLGPEEQEKEYLKTRTINSTQSLTNVTMTESCSLEYTIQGESRPCTSHRVISSCNSGCRNEQLASKCESSPVAYTTMEIYGHVFKNVFCALCNADEYSYASHLACGFELWLDAPTVEMDVSISSDVLWFDAPPTEVSITSDKFSLTLVFDFDPRKGLTVGKHSPIECVVGKVYVPEEDACRPITCPSGFVLDGSDCIPEPSNITAIITGMFGVKPTIQMTDTLDEGRTNLESNIKQDVAATMDSFDVSHEELTVYTDLDFKEDRLVVSSIIGCSCDYRSLFQKPNNNSFNDVKNFEDSIANEVRKDVIKYLLKENIKLESVKAHIESHLNWTSNLDTEQLSCTWLVYQLNETLYGNDTVTVVSTGNTYKSAMYEILDEVAIVCEIAPEKKINTVDLVMSILTLVCLSMSILCLCARIALQFYVSSFQTKPGRIQLQMTIALLFAFIMLVIGPFLASIQHACTTAAILLAYGFLAAFIWMNVIAIDTWLVFRPSSAFSRLDEEDRSLVVHFICGWGIPLLLVTVSIGMYYADVDERFKPEFGGSRCWYTQRYAMLLYFGVPVALSILLNIFLYIHTSINLHKAFRNARTAVKAEGYHFAIYVRLFILMGITWIFGFISAFTEQIVTDIIFIVLTSLQGLFLFISFVCNKRVLSDVKKSVTSETSSSAVRKTKSTSVPSYDSNSKCDDTKL